MEHYPEKKEVQETRTMQPEYQNLAAPSQAHDKPASSRSQGGDAEITDAVDEKKCDDRKLLDTEKDELKRKVAEVEAKVAEVEAKVAEVEAKVAEVEGKKKLIAGFVDGHVAVLELNERVTILGGWDESDRTAGKPGKPGKPSARLVSTHESLEEEKKSLNQQLVAFQNQLVEFQNQLVEFQKRLTLLAQAPPQTAAAMSEQFALRFSTLEDRLTALQDQRVPSSQLSKPVSRSESHAYLSAGGLWIKCEASNVGIRLVKASHQLASVFVEKHTAEEDLQVALSAILVKKKKTARFQWSYTHLNRTGEKAKPDLTCAPCGYTASGTTAVGFIELKSGTVPVSRSDCLGQLAGYLHTALENQSSLDVVYGVVASWKEAVAVVARREGTGAVKYYEDPVTTSPADLVNGITKICCTVKEPISISGYRFAKQFGKGSSCVAYTVIDKSATIMNVVGKVFSSVDAFRNEVLMLGKVSVPQTEGCIPTILAKAEGKLSVVLSPRGRHFRCRDGVLLEWPHAKQLLNVLVHVHRLGIVHCDVRPANFFYDSTSQKAFLNDWASAFDTTSKQYQYNSGRLALPDCFKIPNRADGLPSARDDLYSFILSCYVVRTCEKVEGAIATFAMDLLPSTHWWELLSYVEANWTNSQEISKRLQILLSPQRMLSPGGMKSPSKDMSMDPRTSRKRHQDGGAPPPKLRKS
ncbi:hypothetical protein DIPPA_01360 [Diplonema papillatum]|nr:hypothetical protein DIPPA_01360 [Diplonema papillatum]